MNPQEFVHKWRTVQLKERSFYQEHFLDVCKLIGHSTPAEADKTGSSFTFEAGAGKGFADVWKQNYFAWEYKGKHADLDKAYDQLLQYRENLQNPPLLVVADAQIIRIHTNFTSSVKRVYELALDDLLDPEKLATLKAVFHDPLRLKAPETPEMVTEQAAKEFARLAERLRKWGEDPAQIAHFLIRLLFCLFAEDAGLLPKDLFTRLLARTRRNSAAFKEQLRQLFGAMAAGGWFGEHDILHFDGGLFDEALPLELDSDGMDILHGVSGLDWSSIEPSILGTLFERSLDPGKRAQLGAHYTSRADILLIVEPGLIEPLERKWQAVEAEARDIGARAAASEHAPSRAKLNGELARLLNAFADELRAVRVLDPACGSGNFLYVALRQLLDLWKEVSNLAGELGLPLLMATSAPSPAQLYGIEINEYAHELAQATIWIGYIQWLRENGYGLPPEPILRKLDNIRRMDAILAFDAEGKPVEPEWPEADVVVGNPPFLGGKRMRTELGNEYVDKLFKLWDGKVPHAADLVGYWFETARSYIEKRKLERAGLLATQSIRAGANRTILERIKQTGDIFYAQADRPWILDGASVRVSMVGFDDGSEKDRLLNTTVDDDAKDALKKARKVGSINANLTATADTTQAISLPENSNICYQGPIKVGPFDVSFEIAQTMLNAPININGRPNSDVLRPSVNATDLVNLSRRMWTIDFGTMSQEDAAQYEMPFEYVKKNVYPIRAEKSGDRYDIWWQYLRPRPELRQAIGEKWRCIATPRVAKHRIFVWLSSQVLPDTRIYIFARDDDYFFGVLHSRVHEIWSLATSSRHGVGNDPTYNNTTCFETFPFPWPPGQEPAPPPPSLRDTSPNFGEIGGGQEGVEKVAAIALAARELDEKRQRWLNPTPGLSPSKATERGEKARTLTNLYNQRPTWLQLAHEKLDRAVFAAYGWEWGLSEEEILERLLELNLRRATQ